MINSSMQYSYLNNHLYYLLKINIVLLFLYFIFLYFIMTIIYGRYSEKVYKIKISSKYNKNTQISSMLVLLL